MEACVELKIAVVLNRYGLSMPAVLCTYLCQHRKGAGKTASVHQ